MLRHLGNQTGSRGIDRRDAWPGDVPVGLIQLWLSAELHLRHGSRGDDAAGSGGLKAW